MNDALIVKYYRTKENDKFSTLEHSINGKFNSFLRNIQYIYLYGSSDEYIPAKKTESIKFNRDIYEIFNEVVSNDNVITVGLPIFKFDEKTYEVETMMADFWLEKIKTYEGAFIAYSLTYNSKKLCIRGTFIKE